MIFSSVIFLVYFLPAFLLLYFIVPKQLKNFVLLVSSILFYAWGAPKFIFVILATTTLDFYLVKLMYSAPDDRKRKFFLVLSLCLNVGLLFYFKYCNFFASSAVSLPSSEHVENAHREGALRLTCSLTSLKDGRAADATLPGETS